MKSDDEKSILIEANDTTEEEKVKNRNNENFITYSSWDAFWIDLDYRKKNRTLLEAIKLYFSLKWRSIQEIYYQFLYRFVKKHQYHIIRLPVKPGYCDIDYRLVLANFELLNTYIEEVYDFSIRKKDEKQFKFDELKQYMEERKRTKLFEAWIFYSRNKHKLTEEYSDFLNDKKNLNTTKKHLINIIKQFETMWT